MRSIYLGTLIFVGDPYIPLLMYRLLSSGFLSWLVPVPNHPAHSLAVVEVSGYTLNFLRPRLVTGVHVRLRPSVRLPLAGCGLVSGHSFRSTAFIN